MRPGVALGPNGDLGVVWTDARGQIRAAIGRDHGAGWDPSVRLDQTETPAYRSFTAATMDSQGALHAVWIDSRLAPQAGAEEPADLFYARVLGDQVTEVNLTAEQEPSVCGCCRPDLELAGEGQVRAIFRNTTADGFRDIFTIVGSVEAGFSSPERIGPPVWKLEGCPMSGPIGLGDQVMWRDASSGKWVLRLGTSSDDETTPVFSDETDEWKLNGSPRRVAGTEGVVLVPGSPHSRIITRQGDDWKTGLGDLPVWATSAAAIGETLLIIGAVDGKLELEHRPGL